MTLIITEELANAAKTLGEYCNNQITCSECAFYHRKGKPLPCRYLVTNPKCVADGIRKTEFNTIEVEP